MIDDAYENGWCAGVDFATAERAYDRSPCGIHLYPEPCTKCLACEREHAAIVAGKYDTPPSRFVCGTSVENARRVRNAYDVAVNTLDDDGGYLARVAA